MVQDAAPNSNLSIVKRTLTRWHIERLEPGGAWFLACRIWTIRGVFNEEMQVCRLFWKSDARGELKMSHPIHAVDGMMAAILLVELAHEAIDLIGGHENDRDATAEMHERNERKGTNYDRE